MNSQFINKLKNSTNWSISSSAGFVDLEKKVIRGIFSFSLFREEVDLFLNINQNLYRNIFNALTNYQKRILKALAVTGGKKMTSKAVRDKFELNTSPYVVQGLEFLARKRLIRHYDKKHLFVDPLFRIWVLKYA